MYRDVLYEYESILLGKKTAFSSYFFRDNADKNEQKALYIIEFALRYYLNWTPEQACEYLDWKVINCMKLESLMKYIQFPPEMSARDDIFIIKGKLYPDLVPLNQKEITLKVYKRVLEKDLYKFPKEYLSGDSIGMYRAIVCFQYMLSQMEPFENSMEMYKYFASSKGPKILKKYRLNIACVSMFDHSIDFLHDALPKEQKDEFWYRYYKFKLSNNEQIRELKKKKKFVF